LFLIFFRILGEYFATVIISFIFIDTVIAYWTTLRGNPKEKLNSETCNLSYPPPLLNAQSKIQSD